ncbi:MAG TPA: response regulator [Bryobacteraceae bacterium]|jgi:PAS domain S-box-containing protein|nr:response regulator [Bryobacteraceae bacterium]
MTEQQIKPTVLVVDDEPRILDSIRALLEEDFDVEASTDAQGALAFLDCAPVAVVLVDQRMPGLTGDQFLERARQRSDATRILITGYADIDALIRAVNNGGIHTYVPKPWDPRQLISTVTDAVERFRSVKEQREAAGVVARQQEDLARSEEAYREQTKLLRSILDSMGDGVLVANEQGQTLLFNPAAKEMVGSQNMYLPPEKQAEIYHADMKTPYSVEDLPLMKAGQGQVVDGAELYIKDTEMFLSVNARPLQDHAGMAKGAVAVVRNITASKQAEELLWRTKEEAERANRAKSEFLSRMSHELRTPLNAILGFSQLLEMGSLAVDQRQSVDQIIKGGHHLLRLINEVLDIARIEAGKLTLSPEYILVRETLDDVLSMIAPLAQHREVELSMEMPEAWIHSIEVDRQRLTQVLLNLFSNAIKYNREGGRVSVSSFLNGQDWVRIKVTDTGRGIPADKMHLLFSPFERLGAEQTGIEGTGVGLALSKRIVEAMGGTMGATSELGRGSSFWVQFPRADAPIAPGDWNQSEVIPEPPSPSHIEATVLYIEDNVASVVLVERLLAARPGVKLFSAMQGRIGLDLAREHLPNLILLDNNLPDMGGEQVLQSLRSDSRTKDIPVAMISADATQGRIDRLLTAGAQRYFAKPLNLKELLEFIDALLRVSISERK